MKILASHFVDTENDDLEHIRGLEIQLAFYKRQTFRNFNHQYFLKRLQEHCISVASVHAPAADIYHSHGDEFMNTLRTIREEYGVSIITVHPQRGQRRHAKNEYRKIEEKIKDLGLIIAYETFEEVHEERKWITQVDDMHRYFDALKFPFLGVTYDFTHSNASKNLKEISAYNHRIYAIHLSDARSDMPLDPNEKHQHLPLGVGNYPVIEFLDTLEKIKYEHLLILEYLPWYRHLLIKDAELLSQFIAGDREPLLVEYQKRRERGIDEG